ncbi:MAG: RDD family protein [Proteobacteria bacterium]|nr:RDD family protein [Pseudomonadota bacterium]
MQWYYANGDRREGPVGDDEFQKLASQGVIRDKTLVWNPTMPDWKPWSQVRPQAVVATEAVLVPGGGECAECGGSFPTEDMIPYGDRYVCAGCKPLFVEKLKQGVRPAMDVEYAGFWVRVAAKIVDGLLLGLVMSVIGFLMDPSGYHIFVGFKISDPNSFTWLDLIRTLLTLAYSTWFVGRFGATPGKMALKLRIMVADGSRVSYWRAMGRHFAEYLSAFILGIGYLMVAFDQEKRGLHDRICNTRVIRM